MWTLKRHPYRDVQEGRVFCDVQKKDVDVDGCMSCPRLVSFTGTKSADRIRCWMPPLGYFAEL